MDNLVADSYLVDLCVLESRIVQLIHVLIFAFVCRCFLFWRFDFVFYLLTGALEAESMLSFFKI